MGEGSGGGKDGMLADAGGTSGGATGTSGGRRAWFVGGLALVAFVAFNLIVNATSQIDEFRRLDRDIPAWMPWVWEASSAIGWLAVAPLIALAVVRLRPPQLSWPATLAIHALLTMAVSLAHVGIMAAIRKAVHAMMDSSYRLGPNLPDALLYEWRKDVLSYATFAFAFALIDWLAKRDAVTPTAGPVTPRIEVRDGSRTIWLTPADILWAQAAGNYVELHTTASSLLHRTSLSALERELAPHGFARVHRSRLVRREAVRAVETNASGDFEAILVNGARIGGSRRYRNALEEMMS